MTSIVKFTAVSGLTGADPLCYLLSIDNFCLMLDCGWNDQFDLEIMERLKPHVPNIDAVLLTYPDLNHLAGLPYVVGKLGLNVPVYCTLPVYEMGQMFMYDLYQSHSLFQDFDTFNLDDVDAAFGLVEKLKYQQVKYLTGKGLDLQIRPLNAGHMIGGTMWVINTDQEEFVYAVDFDHKKGRLLEGAEFGFITRPSLLITNSYNALMPKPKKREVKENELMDNIIETVSKGGNVMMPVDTAGRVLELGLMFDQMKAQTIQRVREQKGGMENFDFTVVWINTQVEFILKFAMATLEWMNDDLVKAFEGSRRNPLDFRVEKNVRVIVSLEDLKRIQGPVVVMVTQDSLNTGFAREIFTEYAESENNLILFTSRPAPGTVAYDLFYENKRQFDLLMKRKIPLEGLELERFVSTRKKELELIKQKEEEEEEMKRLEEMDLDDEEIENEIVNPLLTIKHDLPLDVNASSHSSFFKHALRYPMYPCIEPKVCFDNYGMKVELVDLQQSAVKHSSTVKKELEQKKMEEAVKIEWKIKEEAKRNIETIVSVDVKSKVDYLDFESMSDGASIIEFLKIMSPRQVILVSGSEESTDHFVQTMLSNPKEFGRVVAAPGNETIDVTSELNIYQTTLTENLMNQLQFQSMYFNGEEFELAHTDGVIKMEEGQTVPALEPSPGELQHNTVFVGEIVFNSREFHAMLRQNGIQAKFMAGALVCDDAIRIRKEDGQILVEGPVCSKYYKIRNLIYSRFAIV